MPSPLRDIAVLGLFGTLLSLTECSQLTKVDWSLVKPETSTGGGGTSAGGSSAGAENAGAGEGGMAGEAGAAAGEGGQLEGGGDTGLGGTLGGGGGSAGHGGTAGLGGTFGGTGGTSGGGGTAGSGGSGGAGPLHPTCSTAPTVGLATPDSIKDAIVFFDGGAGGNGNRGGRTGLDAACETAKGKLGLLQSMTHAVISVSELDEIYTMPEVYGIPRTSPHVVSPMGIELATSWDQLWQFPGGVPSLVCSGVMPAAAKTWLSGTSLQPFGDPLKPWYGIYDDTVDTGGVAFNNGCNGWTLGTFDNGNQARIGSTIADHDAGGSSHAFRFFYYLVVPCDAASDNILCAAYDPAP